MKKSALILLVAVAISTVSCVDNAESPLVGALRSQQVEWMKAKTAYQVTENEMKTIANTYAAASNALTLKTEESNYAKLAALNANLLITAKYDLAVASAANDVVIANAASALAQAGDDKAIAYLGSYTTATTALATAINNRLDIQNALVAAKLQVTLNPEDITVAIALAQKNIDSENAKIAAANAAIAVYNASTTGTDVTAFKTEKAALDLKNRTLAIDNVRLLYDISRNNLVIAELNTQLTDLGNLRTPKVTSRDQKIADRQALINNNTGGTNDAAIATLTAEIAVLNVAIGTLDTQILGVTNSKTTLAATNVSKGLEQVANTALTAKNISIIEALTIVMNQLTGEYTSNTVNSTVIVFPGGPATLTIKDAVIAQNTIITNAKANIVTQTALLSAPTQKLALITAQKDVVIYTQQLAAADADIITKEKIVAYWKGLLDKIFTA